MKTTAFVALALFFGACHHGHHNPEKHIDWVAGHIEKKLELRPDQKAQLEGVLADVKNHVKERQASAQTTLKTVKDELSKEGADVEKLTALAKLKVRERPTPEQYDAFIDKVAAFYKALDAKQQKIFAEMVRDRLDWLD